jgi:hypothetical protein
MKSDLANRVLRLLVTHCIFEETAGKFHHTATPLFLKTCVYRCMAEEQLDTLFNASCYTTMWIDANLHSKSMRYSNSIIFTSSRQDFYAYHDNVFEMAKRYSAAMRAWGTGKYSCSSTVA